MARAYATSLFVMPWAMLSRICTSRGESGAKTCVEPGPYTESSRNSASTFDGDADDLEVLLLLQPRTDPHGRDPTGVGDQDPDRPLALFAHVSASTFRSRSSVCSVGRSSVTAVPFPGVDWICSVPPMSSARSRMDRSPTDF